MLYFQLDQERKYYSVVFPERRSLEMAETICKLHGGHLPVPINDMENDVWMNRNNSKPLCCDS